MLGYKLISDITVSTAQTSVSFTGLNITKDDDYLLVSELVNTTASNADCYLYFNNNTTNSNYYTENFSANSTSLGASRDNFPYYINSNASTVSFARTNIKLANSGYILWQSEINRAIAGASLQLAKKYGTSTFTATSLTSITITATTSLAIGIGSRFRLYKLTAKKVADITVGTSVTSVDITGLSIDKGSEYMLVSDINNTSGTNANYLIFANNNVTETNYYVQRLIADGTTISSDRANTSRLCDVWTGYKSFTTSNLKLTNSGYFICNNKICWNYGSTIKLSDWVTSSTFTSSSITSLSIKSSVTNGILVGSRFQLYKLK